MEAEKGVTGYRKVHADLIDKSEKTAQVRGARERENKIIANRWNFRSDAIYLIHDGTEYTEPPPRVTFYFISPNPLACFAG